MQQENILLLSWVIFRRTGGADRVIVKLEE